MNSISISGNLGRDVEVRYLANGDPVASFSVADSQGKDRPSIWWNCAIFGKRAESLAPYLLKGAVVTVAGEVTEKEYKDKTGQDRKSMSIRVSNIALQGGKPGASSEPSKPAVKSKEVNFDDLDVPF